MSITLITCLKTLSQVFLVSQKSGTGSYLVLPLNAPIVRYALLYARLAQ